MKDHVELPDGCRVPISDHHQSIRAITAQTLHYEIEFHQRIAELIPPDSVVVDCGACIGSHSRVFSELVGQDGLVIAIEPCEENFEFLAHNVSCFPIKNTFVKFCAVAHRQAFGKRIYRELNVGESEIVLKTDGSSIDVEFIPLDEQLHVITSRRISFIKLDIEGWEYFALIGAWDRINRDHPSMLIEINPPAMKRLGITWEMLTSLLMALGYTFRMWQSPETIPDGGVYDIIATHNHP